MKNGRVAIHQTDMYYVSFGQGSKNLVVLPGLSDGLTTVKGKALFLKVPYKRFLAEYTVYMFSRKNDMPEGYTLKDMEILSSFDFREKNDSTVRETFIYNPAIGINK